MLARGSEWATKSTSAAGRASWDYNCEFYSVFCENSHVSLSQVSWLFCRDETLMQEVWGKNEMHQLWKMTSETSLTLSFTFLPLLMATYLCICVTFALAIPGGPGTQVDAHSIWNDEFLSTLSPAVALSCTLLVILMQQHIIPKYVRMVEEVSPRSG